jgi:hypothetical protein
MNIEHLAIALFCLTLVICLLKMRNKNNLSLKIEIYDSVTLSDIVAMLKLEHLDPKFHIPFIGTSEILAEMNIKPNIMPSPEQTAIFIGILDSRTNKIIYAKLLYVKVVDDETKSLLNKASESGESLVVLN